MPQKKKHPSDPSVVGAAYDVAYASFVRVRRGFWSDEAGYAPLHAAVDVLLRRHSSRKRLRIADIGCGIGIDMELFPRLLRGRGYRGIVSVLGCDLSRKMVGRCRSRQLDVVVGDYRHKKRRFLGADLVWANMSLIHIPQKKMMSSLRTLVSLGSPTAVIGIGIKTTRSYRELIDPADERVNADRFTALYPREMFLRLLAKQGCEWRVIIDVPSKSKTHTYTWIVAQKQSLNN